MQRGTDTLQAVYDSLYSLLCFLTACPYSSVNSISDLYSLHVTSEHLNLVSPAITVCTAFRPHVVFICFVWISEQTEEFALYSINW